MGKFAIRNVPSGVKFDLRADNGEVIASSEVYTSLAACRRGIESVRKSAATGHLEDLTEQPQIACPNPKFQLFSDRAGLYRFRLRCRNGKIVAISEGYTTKAACLAGVESVVSNAPEAPIE